MKNTILFLAFIIYASIIFFVPNLPICIIAFLITNLFIMLVLKISINKMIRDLRFILPFILLAEIINIILEDIVYANYITAKLVLVINITYVYSKTTTVFAISETIKILCAPLKLFKVNTKSIQILVGITFAMVPVLKKELLDLKNVCREKGIVYNIKNSKVIIYKLLYSIIKRVNEIDEALIAKGYIL